MGDQTQKKDDYPNLYRVHATLYTLLYPAFLGAIIVVVFTEGNLPCEWANGLALGFLILYFASQHVVNAVDFKNYFWPMFGLDCLELILMVRLFVLLGIFSETPEIGIPAGEEACFYLILTVCLVLPVLARGITMKSSLFKKGREGLLSILSLSAAAVAFSGVWFGPDWEARWIVLFALLIFYFATGVFKWKFSKWFLKKYCKETDPDLI